MNMRLSQAFFSRVLSVMLIALPLAGVSDAIGQDSSTSTSSDVANQYVLQVGAFADGANASRLVDELLVQGYEVSTEEQRNQAGAVLTVVFVGPYDSAAEAQAAQSSIEANGGTAIVRNVAVAAAAPAPQQAAPATVAPTQRASARVSGTDANLAQDRAQLMAQAQSDLFEVPPVVERPLGMDEGPRVRVSSFALNGAVDREDQDLFVSDLESLLVAQVQSQPAEGFTINQLQAVADEISRYYRERGFFIAQAIVPAQEVRNGVVTLSVLEGTLEDVRVEDNNAYKASVIEGPFRRLRGYPVTQSSIERALLDVQNFPGLTVFGTFTQGDELGNTDLVVRVREEDRFEFTPSADNYGSEFTGEYRANLNFKFNNLLGVADEINAYVLQTFEPDNGTYGGLNFAFPFGRNSIGLGGSINQFDVGGLQGLTDLGVSGEVEQFDVYWDRTFANGRFFGASARLGVATKNALTEVPGIAGGDVVVISEDNLAVASLTVDFFSASRRGRGFTVGSFTTDIGMPNQLGSMDGSGNGISSRTGGDGERAGGSFEKYKFNFQHLRRLGDNSSVLLRVDGQWSDDILVALEQYSIGGPQNVRAYPVAEALVDTGASGTLEWIVNAPGFASKPTNGGRTWGEIFQVSLYADYAYGEINNPRVNEEPTVDYSGFGLGLQFNVPGKLYARVDVASPIGSRIATNDRDPQYFLRMSYTF